MRGLKGAQVMTTLRLLGLAEASVLLGLGVVYWFDYLDHDSFLVVFLIVIAAFFVPSLLAIRSERQAESTAP
jgi:ABC-type Fe3+ transport system permease subunit